MYCDYSLDSVNEGLARLTVGDNDEQQQAQQHPSQVQFFKIINFRDPAGKYHRVRLSNEEALSSFLASNRGRFLVDEDNYYTQFGEIRNGATYTLGGWEGLFFSCQDDDGELFKVRLSSESGFEQMLQAVGCDYLVTGNGGRAHTFADLDVHKTYMFGRD
jgi:hypothetical protein